MHNPKTEDGKVRSNSPRLSKRSIHQYPSRYVLQDARDLFKRILASQLGVKGKNPDGAIWRALNGNPQGTMVYHLACQLLEAQWRAGVLGDLEAYQREQSDRLGVTQATVSYAAALTVKGAKVSRSTLYAWAAEYERAGIRALAPDYHGGRPINATAVDLSIIRGLLNDTTDPSYRLYLRVRRSMQLPGSPITKVGYPRILQELAASGRIERRTPARRRQVAPSRNTTTLHPETLSA